MGQVCLKSDTLLPVTNPDLRRFNQTETSLSALNSVLGYVPTVPHWGYDGNARRYWDFVVAGKGQFVERQIHHYGSGLNALVLLSAFRSNPSDTYLLRAGYAGISGPLSNIDPQGFASCAMHAWPEHLNWDGFSADYGAGFVGVALGSGVYLAEDGEAGSVVAYGGVLKAEGEEVRVRPTDPIRQRVVLPTGTQVSVSGAVIEAIIYNVRNRHVSLTLGQLDGTLRAESALVWVSSRVNIDDGAEIFDVRAKGVLLRRERGGWKVPLGRKTTVVNIKPK